MANPSTNEPESLTAATGEKPEKRAARLILVTRPAPDGPRLISDLDTIGQASVFTPVMDITPNDAPVDLNGIAALAFTSANGVRAFIEKSDRRDLPAFAVGPATAAVCAEAGFHDVSIAGGDVGALADLIAGASGKLSGDVLHVAGVHRASDLSALLVERNVSAQRSVLYEAVARKAVDTKTLTALENSEANGRPIWALFYSARSARLFVDQLNAAGGAVHIPNITAACLREAVAVAAKEAAGETRWKDVLVANEKADDPVLHLMSQGIHTSTS
ncbi:MAG: uroporphyrinogen-III synthase [Pseudomonadota bacterium]